jgi:hypothetical protein
MMLAARTLALACALALLSCSAQPGAGVFVPTAPLAFNAFVGANDSTRFVYPEAAPNSNYSMPSVTARARCGRNRVATAARLQQLVPPRVFAHTRSLPHHAALCRCISFGIALSGGGMRA